jgi:peptidoglycan/xylan/chitin deacetylase (PgdA/CDA1 family)
MSARAFIRGIAGLLGRLVHSVPSIQRRRLDGPNIVYYHWVGAPRPHYRSFYAGCTMERFRADLDVLQRLCDIVPLEVVVRDSFAHRGGRPCMAITFDDGFDLVRSGVMEELDRRGIPATVLLITECVGNRKLMWRNALSVLQAQVRSSSLLSAYNEETSCHGLPGIRSSTELMRASIEWPSAMKEVVVEGIWRRCGLPGVEDYLTREQPYMCWEMVNVWLSAGHSVGLHTRTHPVCSRLSASEVVSEIEQPAAELRSRLGTRFLPFSYPFGPQLPEAVARRLVEQGHVDCVMGIGGLSRRGTPPWALQRAGLEKELNWPIFAKPRC